MGRGGPCRPLPRRPSAEARRVATRDGAGSRGGEISFGYCFHARRTCRSGSGGERDARSAAPARHRGSGSPWSASGGRRTPRAFAGTSRASDDEGENGFGKPRRGRSWPHRRARPLSISTHGLGVELEADGRLPSLPTEGNHMSVVTVSLVRSGEPACTCHGGCRAKSSSSWGARG